MATPKKPAKHKKPGLRALTQARSFSKVQDLEGTKRRSRVDKLYGR
jgi:hypothetical protein